MSFFGLTSFGPESIIQSSLINSNCFTLFTEEEYYGSFQKLQSDGRLEKASIPSLIELTIGSKPLKEESDSLQQVLDEISSSNSYTWIEIQETLKILKGTINYKLIS